MSVLWIVGAGKMGSAVRRGLDESFFTSVHNVDLRRQKTGLPPLPDAVLLAVKPQKAEEALQLLAPLLQPGCCVVSVLAGVSAARLRQMIIAHGGPEVEVIRTMPNLAVAYGAGTTAVFGALSAERQRLVQALFGASVVAVPDEAAAPAVTALSGSGPAYFLALAEVLRRAGVSEGLAPELAGALAERALIDAATMLRASGGTPEQLRADITSPGGTTQAACEVLVPALQTAVPAAVQAAVRRCREL